MEQPIRLNRVPRIVFGVRTSESIPELCLDDGLRRLMIVCDGTLKENGVLDEIFSRIEAAGLEYRVADRIQPDPPFALVDEHAAAAMEFYADAVLGIGGGSTLDIAKGVSILFHNPGSIADYAGVGVVPKKGLPLLLCPTTAGTGSEVTNVAVYSDEGHNKFGVVTPHNIADHAVLDPLLTLGLPAEQTALTGLDALSHALESYVGVYNSFLTEPYALQAIGYVSSYLPRAYDDGSDQEAREFMLRASMLAGLSFTNTQTGGAHACAMALGVAVQLPHGKAVTLMLPSVMRYNAIAAKERYARVAQILDPASVSPSLEEASQHAAVAVERLAERLGVELGLRNYGVTDKDVPHIAELAHRNQRIWVNNPRKPDRAEVESIIRNAL